MTILRPPTDQFRERILVFGSWSCGKSHAWLQIAKWCLKTKSPARFYVLDTDDAIPRMLWSDEFRDVADIIELHTAFDWEEYERFTAEVTPKLKPDDWLVVDFADTSWEAVQRYYIDEVFQKDVGQFFLEARKQLKSGSPLDGWKDWGVINRLYLPWALRTFKQVPCHVYATAHEEKVEEKDEKDIQRDFGRIGIKPGGQKRLPHHFHTVLRFHRVKETDWRITTAKDRQRPYLEGEPWKDFVLSYLVKIAGWRL